MILLTSTPAWAADSFGWQWPLNLSVDDGGAYRVVLTQELYEHIQRPDLHDVTVRNSAGLEVPTAVVGPEEPLAAGPRHIDLPFFKLPPDYRGSNRWVVSRETQTEGQIRFVQTEHTSSWSGPSAGVLVDASRVREPVLGLHLEWPEQAIDDPDPLDVIVMVETSPDLERWITILERGRLVDLQNETGHVLKNTLEFSGAQKYLRVRAVQDSDFIEFTSVAAVARSSKADANWEWKVLKGAAVQEENRTIISYTSPGRYPVQQADIVLDTNSAAEWTLESRDSDKAPWTRRAGPWIGFKVDGEVQRRSAIQNLGTRQRDRQWRLMSSAKTQAVPELRLGFRPEVLLFLAQGDAPFNVVAGSTKGEITTVPLQRLLTTLKASFGPDWMPSPAYLGTRAELDGPGAAAPADEAPEWATWLLWGILILGSAFVAGLAIHLLKNPEKKTD
jgi:hypothetical protein